MAVLQLTESRLPEVFPLKKKDDSITYFNAQNAAILGYNQFDDPLCLVSFLPSTIRSVGVTGNLQNQYAIFADFAPGTELEYRWKVTCFLETEEEEEEEGEEVEVVYDEIIWEENHKRGTAIFLLDVLKHGLRISDIPKLKKVLVSCAVFNAEKSIGTLHLRHRIVDPFEDIAALYTDDGESIAKGGNQRTTYIAADIWRGYFGTPLTWFDKHTDEPPGDPPAVPATTWEGEEGELPLNHPLAVLYGRLLKAGRKNYFPAFNQFYYDDLNAGQLSLFSIPAKNSVGACAVVPHFAAVGLGKIPWQRIGGSVKEKDIFSAFSAMSEKDRIDLYNLARFPKSGVALTARVLDKFLSEAETNNYDHFLGSNGDKTSWQGDRDTALKNDKFVKSLIFEYVNGPQAEIGGAEYFFNSLRFKKALKKTHLHDWSPYVTTILDYELESKEAIGRIEDAYFARRIVTHHEDGRKTVAYKKIEKEERVELRTCLGREEYVVIKTKNLREKKIRFSVVTGNDVLTGTSGEILDLMQWKVKLKKAATPEEDSLETRTQIVRSEFTATVGDDEFLQDEYEVDYSNRTEDELVDLAIAKIGFRRPAKKDDKEDVFAKWKANLVAASADDPATLLLEVWVEDEDPGILINHGPEGGEDLPLPAETGFRFLGSDDKAKQFQIDKFQEKSDAPRVVKAYFAEKNVGGDGTSVSFDPLEGDFTDDNAGHRIVGRDVYVIVEAENVVAKDVKIYVQAGNEILAGEAQFGKPLKLQDRLWNVEREHARQFFKLPFIHLDEEEPGGRVGDDDLRVRFGDGGNPYVNMADDFDEKRAVFRIKLRPNAGRGTFDAWTAAIEGSEENNAPISVRVQVNEINREDEDEKYAYIYYGEENEYEEASCGGSFEFRLPYDVVFQDKEKKELRKIEAQPFTVWNREFFELYDSRNGFNPNSEGGRDADDEGNGHLPMGYMQNDRSLEHADIEGIPIVIFFHNQHDVETEFVTGGRFEIDSRNNGTWVRGWPDGEEALEVMLMEDEFEEADLEGVNLEESRTYADGDIYSRGTVRGVERFRRYTSAGGRVWVMNAPPDTRGPISFTYVNTQRRFAYPPLYAAFLGALGESNQARVSTGFSYDDGTCYPSSSHVNGLAVDTVYVDMAARTNAEQQRFIDHLYYFGFGFQFVGCFMRYDHADSDCDRDEEGNIVEGIHDDHLHSGAFQNDFRELYYD